MSAVAHVVEVTDANFEQIVVEGSRARPVIVDLWAEWCGPCRTLGPLLEKVATERDGAFLLAKLDVDANPMVAGAFGVQSIPTVIAFRDGEPVNGFVGAYPEDAINEFVDLVLPSEAEIVTEEAHEEEEAGDLVGAESDYRDALGKDAENRDAALGLGRILVDRGDLEEARTLLNPLLPDADAERVLARARVREWGSDPTQGDLGEAKSMAAAGQWQEALDRMLGCLGEQRDEARAAMLDTFAAMDDDDPLVGEYRRRLASALF
jgi:putative thioredoxin